MNVYDIILSVLLDKYDMRGELWNALDTLMDDCAIENELTRVQFIELRESVSERRPIEALDYMGIYGGAAWTVFINALECLAYDNGMEC